MDYLSIFRTWISKLSKISQPFWMAHRAYPNASCTFRRNKTGSIAGYLNSSGSIAS
jgi:hypothetical protein